MQHLIYRLSNSSLNLLRSFGTTAVYKLRRKKKNKARTRVWKFNNSLHADKKYIELITKSVPKFVSKYEDLVDKGLFWEMIKMEIRATTISFAKGRAKQKRDEEKELLQQFSNLQEQLRSNFKDTIKTEMDRVKYKLKKIVALREQCSAAKKKNSK